MLKKLFRNEDGGALAELAFVVPFLALLLAGVSEFGRLFQDYTTLSKSTRTAARYLSNHSWTDTEKAKAKNLVVCGKLTCAGGDELLPGLDVDNVCIEATSIEGNPNPITVSVSIPRTDTGCGEPYRFQPIFDIATMINQPTYSLSLPLAPGTTMYYMLDN